MPFLCYAYILSRLYNKREAGPNKGNQPIREDKEKLDQFISQADSKAKYFSEAELVLEVTKIGLQYLGTRCIFDIKSVFKDYK